MDKLGAFLAQAIDDAASLEVKTYVSDDMTAVQYEKGAFTGGGAAGGHAYEHRRRHAGVCAAKRRRGGQRAVGHSP